MEASIFMQCKSRMANLLLLHLLQFFLLNKPRSWEVAKIFFNLLWFLRYSCPLMNHMLWEYRIWSCIFLFYGLSCWVVLIMGYIWYPPSTVWGGRNILWMHLFPDYTSVFIALSFIPVTFADHFGTFRCLWTDFFKDKNGCWFFFWESYIYMNIDIYLFI